MKTGKGAKQGESRHAKMKSELELRVQQRGSYVLLRKKDLLARLSSSNIQIEQNTNVKMTFS